MLPGELWQIFPVRRVAIAGDSHSSDHTEVMDSLKPLTMSSIFLVGRNIFTHPSLEKSTLRPPAKMLALLALSFPGISRIIQPARNRMSGNPDSGKLMIFIALYTSSVYIVLLPGAMVRVIVDLLSILTNFAFSGLHKLGFLTCCCCSCCNSV